MNPCPAATQITVVATVSDENGVPDDIAFVNITATNASAYIAESLPVTMSHNETSGDYEATLTLACCTPAAGYNVTVEAKDNSDVNDSMDGEFSVAGTRALSLNFDKVSFSGSPGSSDNAGAATSSGSSVSPVVKSTGNEVIDIGVAASDLAKGEDSIAGSNTKATIGTAGTHASPYTFNTNTICNEEETAAFTLTIPGGTPMGTYSGSLTISAETT